MEAPNGAPYGPGTSEQMQVAITCQSEAGECTIDTGQSCEHGASAVCAGFCKYNVCRLHLCHSIWDYECILFHNLF